MMLLLHEPKGEKYKKLIDYAFKVCDRFLFIEHSQLHYSSTSDHIMNELIEAFIECKEQNQWPGTISVPKAMVYYFKNTAKAKEVVLAAADSLFSWCSPNLPDDLCFLKGNREWLVTTSHERLCCIKPSNEAEINTIKGIDGLIAKIK